MIGGAELGTLSTKQRGKPSSLTVVKEVFFSLPYLESVKE